MEKQYFKQPYRIFDAEFAGSYTARIEGHAYRKMEQQRIERKLE